MRSLTLQQIAHLLGYSSKLPCHLVQGYATDSRLLQVAGLFFALKGERVDGHDYLEEVRHRGAAAAIVTKEYRKNIPGLLLIPVQDPLQALQKLAHEVLKRSSSRIVAITGSLGKTTTKEMTTHLLATQYRVASSPGNHNSQVGLPLAILNHTTGEEEILVLEMGMTLPGHLKALVQMAPPEVAVLTSVSLVHACHFHSIEEIAWTKAEIFSHPKTRLGILHREIPDFENICRATPCSKKSFSLLSLTADYGLDPLDSTLFHSSPEGKTLSLESFLLPGKHILHNLIASLAVACYFKVDEERLQRALPTLSLPDRRLQFVHHQGILFINDSYNASENSVKAALETLPQPTHQGKKIAVLGSMLELGAFSEECHRRVGEFALKYVDELYCLGRECHPMVSVWEKAGRPVYFFEERAPLVAALRQIVKSEDILLLKGSRAKELWKILEEL